MTEPIGAGERRELRSIVRMQYKVLRSEVTRRKDELQAEARRQLAERYQAQDDATSEIRKEIEREYEDFVRKCREIAYRLKDQFPNLSVEVQFYRAPVLMVNDPNRTAVREAVMAAIPGKIADAQLNLDRQEADLLRELSMTGLTSEAAQAFLTKIPTVGELVPTVRLAAIERAMRDD